ncbi:hypothetical protein [Empedobacter falsenii]|uniref:DUF3037 domain-containing protein n=1 Tax=Empedobacter falsenii TaxID=343874 RepID=A0A376GCX3_9FLAO|nr:hypothetical protein [Empedobacter falsenii]STD58639.1 Uncharacterised protein [Empedobacter falsenii]
MKSFYTLIKVRTNQLSGDSLTIGVVVFNEFKFKVQFSKQKISTAKSLVDIESKFFDLIIKEIKQNLESSNKDFDSYKNGLLNVDYKFNDLYFNYLSRYSNGIIEFTTPKFIALKNTENEFSKIFSMFVDKSIFTEDLNSEKKIIEENFHKRIKTNLIDRVEEKVHTNIKLDNDIIPTLINTFELDCVGKNGVLIGAKSISFNQSKDTIHKNLNTYISIIAHLSKKYHKGLDVNQFFLIADEPKVNTDEYRLWNSIRKEDDIIKVKTSEESTSIAELILSKKASTFIE